jgi:TM2 domain-containing membrane protein YozV
MPKSRLAYILLALFLGTFGVHNFYAGYTGRGIAQLLLSLLSFGFLSPIIFIWAIIEICTVTKDKDGVNFVN